MSSLHIFIDNVRRKMSKKELKARELAKLIGLSPSYLSLILSKNRDNLNDRVKDKIAIALGTTVAELYTELKVKDKDEELPTLLRSQLEEEERIRRDYRELFEDWLYLLKLDDDKLKLALYYSYGSLTDKEVAALSRFFQDTIERYQLSLKGEGKEYIKEKLLYDLKEEERELLSFIALAGNVASLQILKFLIDEEEEVLKDQLQSLKERNLLSLYISNSDIDIKINDLDIRDIAYNFLNPAYRQEIHHRIAEYLEEKKGDKEELIYEIAHHYKYSGEVKKSLKYAQEAGEKAMREHRYKESLMYFQDVLAIAELYPEQSSLIGYLQRMIGDAYYYQSYWSKALAYYQLSLETSKKNKDNYGIARAYCSLGYTYFVQGHFNKAINYLEKGLATPAVEDNSLKALLFINLGDVYTREGRWEKAIEHLEKAVAIATDNEDLYYTGRATISLGLVYYRQGETKEAISYTEKAIEIFEELGDKKYLAIAFNDLAIALSKQGKFEEALRRERRSIELKRELGLSHSLAYSYTEIAQIYLADGQLDKASLYCDRALDILRKGEDELEIARVYNVYGNISRFHQQWEKAEGYYLKSIDIFLKNNDIYGLKLVSKDYTDMRILQREDFNLGQVYLDYSLMLKNMGRDEEALVYLRKAQRITKNID